MSSEHAVHLIAGGRRVGKSWALVLHEVSRLTKRLADAEAERDALAAYVEQLNEHAEACADELAAMIDRYNVQNMEDGSWEYDYQTPFELMRAVRGAPKTSLAQRDARVATGALEAILSDFGTCIENARENSYQAEADTMTDAADVVRAHLSKIAAGGLNDAP